MHPSQCLSVTGAKVPIINHQLQHHQLKARQWEAVRLSEQCDLFGGQWNRMEIFIMWAHFVSHQRMLLRWGDGFQIAWTELSGKGVEVCSCWILICCSSDLLSLLGPYSGQSFSYVSNCSNAVTKKQSNLLYWTEADNVQIQFSF